MNSSGTTMGLARRVFLGAGAVAAGNVAVRILSLFTMPVLTRLLPPSAYGTSALVGTVVGIASVVALAGLDMSYAKSFHAKEGLRGADAEREVWRLGLRLALVVGAGAAIFWALAAPRLWHQPASLAVWVFAGTTASALVTLAQTMVRLRGRYTLLALALTGSGVLSAAVTLGLAYYGWTDERPLLVATTLGYLLPLLLLGGSGLRIAARPPAKDRTGVWSMLQVGLAGILTAPLYWIVSSSDRWFLAALRDTAEVGIYSLGYSVASLGVVVNAAVGAVWLPERARLHADESIAARASAGDLAAKICIALLVTWVAVAAAGGDAIRLLAGPRFHGAVRVVPWIALAVFANGWLTVANAGLILSKRLPLVLIPWGLGALVCVGLNALLVPRYGALGAALTQAITFPLIAAGTWGLAQRVLPMHVPWARLAVACAASLLVGAAMAGPWARGPLASLALKLPVGVAVAGALAWLAAPGAVRRMLSRARPRLT